MTTVLNQRSANAIDEYVGYHVRLQRHERGLSQSQLAGQLGITFQQLQKYERGTNRIGASRLHQISVALNVPISYFFDGAVYFGPELETDRSYLADVLNDPGTEQLLVAFSRIADPDLRRKAVSIIEKLVDLNDQRGR